MLATRGDKVDVGLLIDPVTPACLLYTSDAADERSSVDLGGRRIIKKKTRDVYDARIVTYYIDTGHEHTI